MNTPSTTLLAVKPGYSSLGDAFTQLVQPETLDDCKVIHRNEKLIEEFGLSADFDFTQLLIPNQYQSYASVYSGHQFGVWAGQLGDGRALSFGELINNSLNQGFEIQLKGTGQTPYSRFADGRAVLRSSIREYLASETLHQLGIPSTRALAIISSSTDVYRETAEKASVIVRCARTHIRFGHFEHFFYTNKHDELKQLADYVWDNFFEDCDSLQQVLETIIKRTAKLIAQWQAYGFCHGVMNTDNMSIIGDTIDYGPYGFLDNFDPTWICNHSDHQGRYRYNNQPSIGLWNCNALAHAFSPLLEADELKQALHQYEPEYWASYHQLMAKRLGFEQSNSEVEQLVKQLLEQMQAQQLDFNNSFLVLEHALSDPKQVLDFGLSAEWIEDYCKLINPQTKTIHQQANPRFILRNYMAQQAIAQSEAGNHQSFNDLFAVLQQPFQTHPNHVDWEQQPPEWASQLELSCSS